MASHQSENTLLSDRCVSDNYNRWNAGIWAPPGYSGPVFPYNPYAWQSNSFQLMQQQPWPLHPAPPRPPYYSGLFSTGYGGPSANESTSTCTGASGSGENQPSRLPVDLHTGPWPFYPAPPRPPYYSGLCSTGYGELPVSANESTSTYTGVSGSGGSSTGENGELSADESTSTYTSGPVENQPPRLDLDVPHGHTRPNRSGGSSTGENGELSADESASTYTSGPVENKDANE